jgi:pimeloyl-ACP methyl ester carboxylesterase
MWLVIPWLPNASAQAEKLMSKSVFADFGGTKVHYQTIGDGSDALIFVHGWACSADVWSRSINEFPEYQVVAIDLPGHGQSDKPRTRYTMDYFARSIEAVMGDAGIRRAVLVGHSMGTPVMRQFYRLYPKQTLALVVVDGPLRPVGKAETEQALAALRADYKEESNKAVNSMIQPIRDVELKERVRSIMLATPDYVGLSAAEGMADKAIWTDARINVPVLAIMAESLYWKPDTETFYRSIAPNLDLQVWPGVSHFLMMEHPAAFNESLRSFVSRNGLL